MSSPLKSLTRKQLEKKFLAIVEEQQLLEQTKTSLLGEKSKLLNEKAALERENAQLKARYEALRRQLFGKKSEKIKVSELLPGMLALFTEEELAQLEDKGDAIPETEAPEPRKKRGRRPLSKDLPREIVEIELSEADRKCPGCDQTMCEIGIEVTERLGFIPAKAYVRELRHHKYACRCCHGGGVLTAPGTPHVIPQGRAETNLLAHVVVSKYVDHLPLYRQALIFKRLGIDLCDSTLCAMNAQVADALKPIVASMKVRLLARSYLQADETTLRVLDPESRGIAHQGYLWVYGIPGDEVVYDFRMGRGRDGPTQFLRGFVGKLQVDGYAGYDEAVRLYMLVVARCWAHIRRKFVDARSSASSRAEAVIARIQRIYRIEQQARDGNLSYADRRALRQEQSKPIVKELFSHLEMLSATSLPESDIGAAAGHALNARADLEAYLEHGEVEIDNNWIEQAMRPVAIGRKNYLFAGSAEGGERAAILYSVIESARRLKLNPYEYLKDVLDRLPNTASHDIGSLTPHAWAAARSCTTAATAASV
ncbi:MAG: IS66 family transposase [Planctomycetota bacterium]|mgnify:CR=1 FL=1